MTNIETATETSRQIHQIAAIVRAHGAATTDRSYTTSLADGQVIHVTAGTGAVAELRGLGYELTVAGLSSEAQQMLAENLRDETGRFI